MHIKLARKKVADKKCSLRKKIVENRYDVEYSMIQDIWTFIDCQFS